MKVMIFSAGDADAFLPCFNSSKIFLPVVLDARIGGKKWMDNFLCIISGAIVDD